MRSTALAIVWKKCEGSICTRFACSVLSSSQLLGNSKESSIHRFWKQDKHQGLKRSSPVGHIFNNLCGSRKSQKQLAVFALVWSSSAWHCKPIRHLSSFLPRNQGIEQNHGGWMPPTDKKKEIIFYSYLSRA